MSLARDWMKTARLSNLPTVWSNVLVGALLGGGDVVHPGMAAAIIGASLIYAGGMVLNDVADVRVDRIRGTDRPLATGRLSVRTALLVACALLLGGSTLILLVAPPSVIWVAALLGAVAGYDLLNKRFPAAIVLMGLCRGLLIVTAAVACGGVLNTEVLTVAATLTVATTLVTLIARDEHRTRPTPTARLGVVVGFFPVFLLIGIPQASESDAWLAWAIALFWALLAALWGLRSAAFLLRSPIRPRAAIMGWLAGLPMIDAVAIALWSTGSSGGKFVWSILPVLCALLTIGAHRRIAGT